MTVKLGTFTMPMHHPARDYATILEEDQEAGMPRVARHAEATRA